MILTTIFFRFGNAELSQGEQPFLLFFCLTARFSLAAADAQANHVVARDEHMAGHSCACEPTRDSLVLNYPMANSAFGG
jgi:hypothetical protein